MKHMSALLATSVLLISLNASEQITPTDEKEFPYIKPIAIEYIVETDKDKDGVFDSKDKCPDTPLDRIVDADGCQLDGDDDGVLDFTDKCPQTPAGRKVDADGCQLDSDGDGVIDFTDQCPDTPKVFEVDSVGCPLTATLKANFDSNKYDIKPSKQDEIKQFAQFLKDNEGYDAVISGHTDSSGNNKSNQILSDNRANAVMEALINEGVDASRLKAVGEGDKEPIADNINKEGRAKNRRIEIELTNNQTNK